MKAESIYRALLHLYPRDYRALFADEMSNAFAEAAAEKHEAARLGFAVREFVGLMFGASAEWIAKFSTDPSIRARTLPDRVKMRPPGVAWETYYAGSFAQPDEVKEAQRRTDDLVGRIVHAIAHHDFQGARNYAREERDARETLRVLREKHGISE